MEVLPFINFVFSLLPSFPSCRESLIYEQVRSPSDAKAQPWSSLKPVKLKGR